MILESDKALYASEMDSTTTAAPNFWQNLAGTLVTTAGSLVEKNITSKTAAGTPPVNANPASLNNQPSGLVPGVSNKTLMIAGGAFVGLVLVIALIKRK